MPRRFYEVKEELDRARADHRRLDDESRDLTARLRSEPSAGLSERLDNVRRGLERRDVEIADLEAEYGQAIGELAENPRNREAGAEFRGTDRRDTADDSAPAAPREARDSAMRTLERHANQGHLTAEAVDRVDELVRERDPMGVDAAYVTAAGDEHYDSAFGKMLRYGDGAVLRMTREEQEAVQAVNRAEQMRAALAVGAGGTGGFALPIAVDPTINLSSNGAINPIRQLADVRTMSTRELRLLTADSFVAQYQAEAAEAIDNSPALAQPTLIAQRATSFVPFSFEVDQDWSSVKQELAKGISDAKDVLEATKFLLGAGSGSNEPVGILSIGTSGALTTTQRVQTAGAGVIAVGDVYALKAALGQTRFAASGTFTMNPSRLDSVYRLTPSGSTTEPQIMDSRSGTLLGRPVAEWSTMATATTTGSKWSLYGDFRQGYVIGDRLGMSLEIIPHLFGATNRYPTGQRGAYAIWRNDGRCKVLTALRYGEVL